MVTVHVVPSQVPDCAKWVTYCRRWSGSKDPLRIATFNYIYNSQQNVRVRVLSTEKGMKVFAHQVAQTLACSASLVAALSCPVGNAH